MGPSCCSWVLMTRRVVLVHVLFFAHSCCHRQCVFSFVHILHLFLHLCLMFIALCLLLCLFCLVVCILHFYLLPTVLLGLLCSAVDAVVVHVVLLCCQLFCWTCSALLPTVLLGLSSVLVQRPLFASSWVLMTHLSSDVTIGLFLHFIVTFFISMACLTPWSSSGSPASCPSLMLSRRMMRQFVLTNNLFHWQNSQCGVCSLGELLNCEVCSHSTCLCSHAHHRFFWAFSQSFAG